MPKYILDTGLASTYAQEFESDEEAWNELSDELNEKYGIPKSESYDDENPEMNGIVATLYRYEEIEPLHPSYDDYKTRKVPVTIGYIALDWDDDGEIPPYERDQEVADA